MVIIPEKEGQCWEISDHHLVKDVPSLKKYRNKLQRCNLQDKMNRDANYKWDSMNGELLNPRIITQNIR